MSLVIVSWVLIFTVAPITIIGIVTGNSGAGLQPYLLLVQSRDMIVLRIRLRSQRHFQRHNSRMGPLRWNYSRDIAVDRTGIIPAIHG